MIVRCIAVIVCHPMVSGDARVLGQFVCQYVNCVGCDPDFVDRTVPEGGDDYPVATLSSEPICVITDDMTYQERMEALSGTIYDHNDVIDNQPGYFDYDDHVTMGNGVVGMIR